MDIGGGRGCGWGSSEHHVGIGEGGGGMVVGTMWVLVREGG